MLIPSGRTPVASKVPARTTVTSRRQVGRRPVAELSCGCARPSRARRRCEHTFASLEYRYTITEHDPERPWIVRRLSHATVTLEEGASFSNWAAEQWPAPRWSVEIDPYQLAPRLRSEGAGQ